MAGANRYDTAAQLSAHTFSPDVERVFVATGTNFPDGLSASAAASHFDGPVLLADPDNVASSVLSELRRLRPRVITAVGGTAVISENVIEQLSTVAPTSRLAGSDRYDTAATIATTVFTTAETVYLASGATFADALPGSTAAARLDAPVLLSAPDGVPGATADALGQLGTRNVVLLGGEKALGEVVADELADMGLDVERIAGADRYATAAAISRTTFPDGADVVYLASGRGFADALGGGAAAAFADAPMLTVPVDRLPAEVAAEIKRLAPRQLFVLGGNDAIDSSVMHALTSGE
jgi:putative cell wall-binding protein